MFAAAVAVAAGAFLAPARASLIIQSYWQLGEGANVGVDSSSVNDGEVNNLNQYNATVQTASPSGVNGSTAYAHTTGADMQGLWMFGAGSNDQNVPADNWGVQFMVRCTENITSGWRAVYGMAEGLTGGLVIEAAYVGGNVYWDVNKQGVANYIIPRNATTLVAQNEWTALALVKDAGTFKFYVNKVLAGSNSGAISYNGLLAFGLQQNVGNKSFQGDFDEAQFFTFNAGQFNPTVDLIPEPATAGLVGLFGAMALLRRRMKIKK